MTTAFAAVDAIARRWLTNWTTTPTALQNEDYTPTRGVSWARLSVLHLQGEQESMGAFANRRFLRRGQVKIQLFTPAYDGTAEPHTLGQAARAIFEGTSFDGLRFFSGDVVEIGVDGEWFMTLVDCLFDYQEIK